LEALVEDDGPVEIYFRLDLDLRFLLQLVFLHEAAPELLELRQRNLDVAAAVLTEYLRGI